jgi:hypothetical protein
MVVFPEPEGPMRARNSPLGIPKEMFFRTGISRESLQYDFEMLLTSTSDISALCL